MLGALLLAALCSLPTMATAKPAPVTARDAPRVLVFTKTEGYRHDSIPAAKDALRSNAQNYGVQFKFSEDDKLFTDNTLEDFDALMFVHNSGEILNTDQQAAMARYFGKGGVYMGVHSASACLYNDTDYLKAVGAFFDFHPELQPATFVTLNTTHPATAPVPGRWSFTEEVYYFRSNPRDVGAEVIMTVENSYIHGGHSTGQYPPQGKPHPIAWYIEEPEYENMDANAPRAGRSFYTSLGHLNSTWANETFIEHIFGGLTWALEGATTRAYGVGLVGHGKGSKNITTDGDDAGTSSGASSAASTQTSSVAAQDKSGSGSGSSSGAGHAVASAGALGGALAAGLMLVM